MAASVPPKSPQKCVAVMQPYFFPYAGYFRLFAAADLFIIFDCVQFPRRGRVHRTEVPGSNGAAEWLTLPLMHHPRDVQIRDLAFSPDSRDLFEQRLSKFQWVRDVRTPAAKRIQDFLAQPIGPVIDYLEASLRLVIETLGFHTPIIRSSVLDIDPSLRGQERVIAAAASVGATRYVNLSGGRALYDGGAFAEKGIELTFLTPYAGQFFHLLPALMTTPALDIRRDVDATTQILKGTDLPIDAGELE
ncbi:MAG: WbqC family protein [Rhodomicrobium sp.]